MLTGGVIGVSSLAYALSGDEGDIIRSGQVATKPMNVAGLYVPPSVMLVMGREHNLFAEAYDDASDIDGDGYLDVMYDPSITYEGIFDPTVCYSYNNNTNNLSQALPGNIINGYWVPAAKATYETKTFEKLWHAGTEKGTARTVPVCNAGGKTHHWLGNFLNYVTTSRIDAIRKILYGGTRLTNSHLTSANSKPVHYKGTDKDGKSYKAAILKHSRVIRDGHAWGKVLGDAMYKEGGNQVFRVKDFTGLSSNSKDSAGAYFFGIASYDSDKFTDNAFGQGRFMRIVYNKSAGMPGVKTSGSKNIWDWVSRQTDNSWIGAVGTSSSATSSGQAWTGFPSSDIGGIPISTVYDSGASTNMAEASVAVVVCTPDFHSETDCRNYSSDRANPEWQPAGLLQQYGEGSSPRIKFGLITGSWKNNLGGGALRANLGDFASEVYTSNPPKDFRLGDFNYSAVTCASGSNCGFVKAIDNMNIARKNDGDQSSGNYDGCDRSMSDGSDGVYRIAKIQNGTCNDWGNPVAKLLYTAALYFKNEPISQEADNMSAFGSSSVSIGHVQQKDPYTLVDYCSKPVALLIADENISFDYDNAFGGAKPFGSDNNNIITELNNVVSAKGFKAGDYIVGGNATKQNDMYYYVPSVKQIDKLGDVEGIAPSAAYSHGSYNVAGVASYYSTHVIRTAESSENEENKEDHYMKTYVVAMKPNLPEININVDGNLVTILPFAKTMGDVNKWCKLNDAASDDQKKVRQCQSTNQIADFYVQEITDTSGVFRINYEDYQYGSDYDMDWVVEYDYEVIKGSEGSYVRVVTRHLDGDKYAPQHAGYLITGVEHAGVYVDLGKTTAHNPTGDASKNEIGYPQGNTDEASEVYNFYDLDTIISDYNIINCRELKYASTRDFNSEVPCRFQGTYNSKADYKLDGQQLNSSNIDKYYGYITKQDFTVTANGVTENINLYYANRLDIAKVMNVLESNDKTECSKGSHVGKKDKAGITARCFDPGDNAGSKYMCGGHNRFKHLFGTPCRRDHGKAASRVFKVASSSKNYWLKSPLWYAARFGLGTVKDTFDPSDAKENNIANYYEVTNMTKLRDGIARMLDQIKNVHSSSGFSPVSNETKAGIFIYPSIYDPSVWSGDVYQATVSSVGGYDLSGIRDRTSAASGFNAVSPDNRFVFTYDVTAADTNRRLVRFYSAEDTTADGNIAKGAFSNLTCNIIRQILQEGGECSGTGGEGATQTYDGQYYSLDDKYSRMFMNRFVRWVLGEHDNEGLNTSDNASKRLPLNGGGRGFEGTPLRQRIADGKNFVLADIINSTPTYFADGEKGYLAVGANDGMLHFIDTSTMQPVLSYIPSAAWSHMKQLTSQSYDHYSFVDSTPQVYKRGNKTYIYGSFGLGLRGAYLLDVTGISSFASKTDDGKLAFANGMLQWELTDKFKIADDVYAGSDYVGNYQEAPTLINAGGNKDNVHNKPYLIFTGGVNSVASSASGKAPGVFIVNMLGETASDESCYVSNESGEFNVPKTASVVKGLKLPCVVASQALADAQHVHDADIHAFSDPWDLGRTPDYTSVRLAIVSGNDANALGFYFGDSFGNLWRHSLGNDAYVNKPYNWFKKCDSDCSDTVIAPKVMFVARDSSGRNQPITVTPETGYYGGDGIAVAVGTGSYIYTYDSNVVSKVYNSSQSVYLLRDMGSVAASAAEFKGRCGSKTDVNCLKPLNVSSAVKDDKYYRSATVNTEYNKTQNYGWYMDLIPYDANGPISNSGERIDTNMLIIDNKLTITPNIPAVGDNCRGSGTSSLQQIDYMAGTLSTEKEIDALVTHLSATIHYDENGMPGVVIHATVDNAEKKEGDEAIHSIELTQDVNPTRSSSWIRLF
ncbi:pilus assembly protein [Succinimonas sp.]|uniref:pilus assembly protein n=1 Tax=Succinimonas sp. TaxID=1936151 RepID=UPI0038636939